MKSSLVSGPSVEPLSKLEVKRQLRLESTNFADDITAVQSIPPGSHAIAASYSLEGAGIDVLGYDSMMILEASACGSGATVDVKLQESDDDSTYTDWSGGAFDQVSESNDNTTYEKAYTGTKQYIRAVSTVAVDACSFGVTVLKDAATSAEDDFLDSLIAVARVHTEGPLLNRKLITQTWDIYFDAFPGVNEIQLPFGSLQSVTSIKYTDVDDVENTFSSDNYYVDTVSIMGRVVLKSGISWPSTTLRPMNPVVIRIVCGYGDAGSDVPIPIRQAMLIKIADMYENREESLVGTIYKILPAADNLVAPYRLWEFGS